MTRTTALTAAMTFALAGNAAADINIGPFDSLPDESYFDANPGEVINILESGLIAPSNGATPFNLNGATINVLDGAQIGFATLSVAHMDHVDVVVESGGSIDQGTVFAGASGTSSLLVKAGADIDGLLTLRGNTTASLEGGEVSGGVASGAAAIVAEDDSVVVNDACAVGKNALFSDDSHLDMTGGSFGDFFRMEDDATATISGGTIGRWGTVSGTGATVTMTGGTTGMDFVVERGTFNLDGGGLGSNAGMVAASLPYPTFNMTEGAIASGFRCYKGTMTVSGGSIGSGFRLGTASGDGSGATLVLVVKHATIDGLDVTPAPGDDVLILNRAGEFLSVTFENDDTAGFTLNEFAGGGADYFRSGASLYLRGVEADCLADVNGDGSLSPADFTAWLGAYNAGTVEGGDQNGDGLLTPADFTAWLANYGAGCP